MKRKLEYSADRGMLLSLGAIQNLAEDSELLGMPRASIVRVTLHTQGANADDRTRLKKISVEDRR